MSDEREDLVAAYQDEAREYLVVLEAKLLALEKGEADEDDINAAFRAIHTVKGGAGFFGLSVIGDLSHCMEELLGKYRSKAMEQTDAGTDALLEGFETLMECFEDVESSNKNVDNSGPVATLNKILNTESTVTPTQDKESEPKKQKIKVHPFGEVTDSGMATFWIKVSLDDISSNEAIEELKSVGEVIKTFPKDLSKVTGEFDALFSSVLDISMLEHLACKLNEVNPIEECQSKEQADITEEEQIKKEVPKEVAKKAPTKVKAKKKEKHSPSVRVDFDQLSDLINLSGELILSRNQFINKLSGPLLDEFQSMSKQVSELQEGLMKTRMQPLSVVTMGFPRLVRNLAKQLGKKVDLKVIGEELELDRNILEGISGPFTHILRNSLDHGVESPEERHAAGKSNTGKITVHAFQKGGFVTIEVKDDGKGIDPEKIKGIAIKKGVLKQSDADLLTNKEAISLIYAPGFSTAEEVTDVSGRGVGMDVVKTEFEKMGGTVDLDSKFGSGTTLTVQLPLSVAIIQSLIVKVAGELYAIPRNSIKEVVSLDSSEDHSNLERMNGTEVLRYRSSLLPVVRMSTILEATRLFGSEEEIDRRENLADRREEREDESKPIGERRASKPTTILVMALGEHKFGIVVDEVSHQEETVVKPLNETLKHLDHYMGVTILSSGKVCFILDTQGFCKMAEINFSQTGLAMSHAIKLNKEKEDSDLDDYLIFENSPGEKIALLAGLVKKTATASRSEVMKAKSQTFITHNEVDYNLIYLHKGLELTEYTMEEEFYYIIPKYSSIPFAFVASSVCGIKSIPSNLELIGKPEQCKVGTVVHEEELLTVLDLYKTEDFFFEGMENRKSTKLGGSKQVLVAEDALIFRKILKGYLEDLGVRCDMAINGKEALTLLESKTYDMIISDIQMPEMDGYELAAAIRDRDQFNEVPVIALTSLASDESRQKGFEAGFNEYLVKTDRENFMQKITDILTDPTKTESPIEVG